MKKSLLPILFCLFVSLTGCGNNGCTECSCSTEDTPADTGSTDIETGAYVFQVKDKEGKAVSGAEFEIVVVRKIPGDTWINTVGEKYTATSDADGDVTFSLNQLENIETGGDYGLLSMRDVEDRTPEGYKKVEKNSNGEEEISGLYCVDEKGGVYTGGYCLNSDGEYRTYYLNYAYAGEVFAQHAVHQYDLQWTWERTLNRLFTTQVSHREWDGETAYYVRKYEDGGYIKVKMTKAPDGYSLLTDSQNLSFDYKTSGDAYDKFCHTANYVFASDTVITL